MSTSASAGTDMPIEVWGRKAGKRSAYGAGSTVPTAVALWASVSPEIDRRLSSDLDKPLLLRPNEWATGDIVWLVALAGDRRALPKFLARLRATEFKGRQVKLRTNGPDGKVVVKTLGPSDTAVAAG